MNQTTKGYSCQLPLACLIRHIQSLNNTGQHLTKTVNTIGLNFLIWNFEILNTTTGVEQYVKYQTFDCKDYWQSQWQFARKLWTLLNVLWTKMYKTLNCSKIWTFLLMLMTKIVKISIQELSVQVGNGNTDPLNDLIIVSKFMMYSSVICNFTYSCKRYFIGPLH